MIFLENEVKRSSCSCPQNKRILPKEEPAAYERETEKEREEGREEKKAGEGVHGKITVKSLTEVNSHRMLIQ